MMVITMPMTTMMPMAMNLNVFNDIVEEDHDWVFQNSKILKYSFQQSVQNHWNKKYNVFNDTLEDDHDWIFQNSDILK